MAAFLCFRYQKISRQPAALIPFPFGRSRATARDAFFFSRFFFVKHLFKGSERKKKENHF
jgi:hypothetical protein